MVVRYRLCAPLAPSPSGATLMTTVNSESHSYSGSGLRGGHPVTTVGAHRPKTITGKDSRQTPLFGPEVSHHTPHFAVGTPGDPKAARPARSARALFGIAGAVLAKMPMTQPGV